MKESIPRILVAEDNEVDAMLIEALLKDFYQVDLCADGASALTILKEKKYDLLITDLDMPVMGGIELMVVAEALYPELPVIVVSSTSWQYHNYQERYPNAKVWVDKPYKPSTLLGMVAGTIAANPYI